MMTERRRILVLLLPVMLVLAVTVLPLMLGTQTLFMRDIFSFHLPVKTVQAESMRSGLLPLIDPLRGGGQPLLGNPNAVALYPDNVLYLVAPTLWSLNAHFWIHLLLAPCAMLWLGRRWGLSAVGAAAAGVFWGLSGFFLSQLNFYNLVAGTALVPAFLASALSVLEARLQWWKPVVCAALWALLILGGDPILAAQAGLLLVLFVVLRGSRWRARSSEPSTMELDETPLPRRLIILSVALVGGVLLALPQLVEFLRILPLSYRGHWGYGTESVLVASLSPLSIWEWFLPFAYGRPNLGFWGAAMFGDEGAPFFWSLFPGSLALLCVFASGQPGSRRTWGLWAIAGLGLFVALGGYNPLMRLVVSLPGLSLARYPVKFVLLTAVASCLLAGIGFQRLFEERRLRTALQVASGLAVVYLATAAAALNGDGWLAGRISRALGPADGLRLQQILQNWIAMSVFLLVVLAAGLLCVTLARSRATLGAALFLVLHAGSQLFLLRPLLPMEDVSLYGQLPRLAGVVQAGERVAHVESGAFGANVAPRNLPSGEVQWLTRQFWADLSPSAGVTAGIAYEFNKSPEGLDSFLNRMSLDAMRSLTDPQRLRMAEAFGVDLIFIDRPLPLEVEGREMLRLRTSVDSFGQQMRVYEVLRPAPLAALLGERWPAPHLNAAVDAMIDSDFDPLRAVVTPGEGEVSSAPGGEVEIREQAAERWVFDVDSPQGGVLLLQRSHQPLYRARIDGLPAAVFAANLSRMGIDVPAGRHEVVLETDRTPLLLSSLVSCASFLGLLAFGWFFARTS